VERSAIHQQTLRGSYSVSAKARVSFLPSDEHREYGREQQRQNIVRQKVNGFITLPKMWRRVLRRDGSMKTSILMKAGECLSHDPIPVTVRLSMQVGYCGNQDLI
jgi:hypothetical protein